MLKKDKVIMRNENEVAKEIHCYFTSIISSLGVTGNEYMREKHLT